MSDTLSVVNEDQQRVSLQAWSMLFVCMLAYIFSFIDRQVIALLVEHIRSDLHISDTQFSLLHGLSFALFYSLMGLPIARLADTRSRPVIISIGIAVWSIATAACGLAKNFWQLFFARMGVGAGEAALSPAAYSMITDSFPKSKLGLALGIYSMGSFLGAGLAFIVGGVAVDWMVNNVGTVETALLGPIKPWQMTFFAVGLPGVLLAILCYFLVKDPPRKGIGDEREGYSIQEVLNYIGLHKVTFTAHYLGFALLSLVLFAMLSWAPAYLLRNFGLSTAEVGLYLGVIVLLGNSSGVLCSGWLTDYLSAKGFKDAPMRTGIIGGLGTIVPVLCFPWLSDFHASLALLACAFFFASFPMATSAAALQLMAPNQMRAQVTAIFFLFMNLLGITGGATLVALLTDYVFRDEKMVGFSIAIVASSAAVLAALVMNKGLAAYCVTIQQLETKTTEDGG